MIADPRDTDGAHAPNGAVAAYPDDYIELPSWTRPGRVHRVLLNVLANQPVACTCEAWTQRNEWCHAMKEVAAEECSYPLQRCAEPGCGAILRLGRFWTGSGHQDIFVCPFGEDHSRREAAAARLTRGEQPMAVGSRGAWRLPS